MGWWRTVPLSAARCGVRHLGGQVPAASGSTRRRRPSSPRPAIRTSASTPTGNGSVFSGGPPRSFKDSFRARRRRSISAASCGRTSRPPARGLLHRADTARTESPAGRARTSRHAASGERFKFAPEAPDRAVTGESTGGVQTLREVVGRQVFDANDNHSSRKYRAVASTPRATDRAGSRGLAASPDSRLG